MNLLRFFPLRRVGPLAGGVHRIEEQTHLCLVWGKVSLFG